MKKTIITVFLVLAVVVLVFLIWELFFTDNGGILHTAYNSVANGVNTQWKKLAGDDAVLMPLWDTSKSNKKASHTDGHDADNETGFDIDIAK